MCNVWGRYSTSVVVEISLGSDSHSGESRSGGPGSSPKSEFGLIWTHQRLRRVQKLQGAVPELVGIIDAQTIEKQYARIGQEAVNGRLNVLPKKRQREPGHQQLPW